VNGHRGALTPEYNRSGTLEAVSLDGTIYVQRISYDAKGQRTLIAYGNGAMTRYSYDPHTFRLARLRSEPYAVDGVNYRPAGPVLQDLGYEYDLAGNILAVHDRTPGCGVPPTLDALDRTFTYDPVYRLRSATGREQQTPVGGDPWIDVPRGTDPTQTQRYTETYHYDPVGNLLQLVHQPTAPHLTSGFTRDFANQPGNNRLRLMTVSGTPYDYSYDDNGNLITETTSRHFTWNHADQLATFATQTLGAEPSVHAHYLYDPTGQRIVKLVRRQGNLIEVTRYVGGFEHHRWGGTSPGENNHVHITDDDTRIALVRLGPAAPGDGGPAIQFHLGDHLGSSVLVIDDAGVVTNREEFTPYGETSFGSFARKRYRFTGKERDEESGLSYHQARYFVPWLARWLSCDPVEENDTGGRYGYCACNPVRLADPTGEDPHKHEAMFRTLDTDRSGQLDAQELTSACVTPTALRDFLLDEPGMIPGTIGQSRYTDSGYQMREELLEPVYASMARQKGLYPDSPVPMTREDHDAFVENAATARRQARLMFFNYLVELIGSTGLGGGGPARGGPRSMERRPSRSSSPRPPVRQAKSPSGKRVKFTAHGTARFGGKTRAPAPKPRAYPAALGATASSGAVFMDRMLRIILADPQHPLRFLINPKTQNWRARSHLSQDPTVQAGHLTSRHSGEPERFAIEDAFFNQASSNKGETQGAIFRKQAVEIGGVPVELRTALQYQRLGKIP
jgi:RHS repeat-associated protein